MTEPQRYQIATLEDMIRTYAVLPQERGELMLKELGDAVRMMAPMAEILASPMAPLTWINDTKGTATVNLKTQDERFNASFKIDLPDGGK